MSGDHKRRVRAQMVARLGAYRMLAAYALLPRSERDAIDAHLKEFAGFVLRARAGQRYCYFVGQLAEARRPENFAGLCQRIAARALDFAATEIYAHSRTGLVSLLRAPVGGMPGQYRYFAEANPSRIADPRPENSISLDGVGAVPTALSCPSTALSCPSTALSCPPTPSPSPQRGRGKEAGGGHRLPGPTPPPTRRRGRGKEVGQPNGAQERLAPAVAL
jgi:hypothetical protein